MLRNNINDFLDDAVLLKLKNKFVLAKCSLMEFLKRNIFLNIYVCTFTTLPIDNELSPVGTYKGEKDPGSTSAGVKVMDLRSLLAPSSYHLALFWQI